MVKNTSKTLLAASRVCFRGVFYHLADSHFYFADVDNLWLAYKMQFIHLASSDNHLPNSYSILTRWPVKSISIHILQMKVELEGIATLYQFSNHFYLAISDIHLPNSLTIVKHGIRKMMHLPCNCSHLLFVFYQLGVFQT